jgi:plasmid stability protein
MSTKLDIPDDLAEDVRLRAEEEGRGLDETAAALLRIGLASLSVQPVTAIRATSSMLEQRKRIADKFITGEWGLELAGFREGRDADRESAEVRARAWSR